jgi:hypothetical protein
MKFLPSGANGSLVITGSNCNCGQIVGNLWARAPINTGTEEPSSSIASPQRVTLRAKHLAMSRSLEASATKTFGRKRGGLQVLYRRTGQAFCPVGAAAGFAGAHLPFAVRLGWAHGFSATSRRTSWAWRWVSVLWKTCCKWVRTVVKEIDNSPEICLRSAPCRMCNATSASAWVSW